MSPEQAQGKVVDKRSDIWAFGVVLHEMLTGRRVFQGDTMAETLAAVLTKEPDWERIPAQMQPLLRRCLTRDLKRRLRDIGDAMAMVETAPVSQVAAPRHAWPWAVAGVLAIGVGVALWAPWRAQAVIAEPIRFQIPLTVTPALEGSMALSPDGKRLAYNGIGPDGIKRIWLRTLDSLETKPLAGTEYTQEVQAPFFWSPDSRFIAFDGGGKLKKIDVTGGATQVLCDLTGLAVGGSWSREGVIIFGTDAQETGIMRVPESGGMATPVTKHNGSRGERPQAFPLFLPDGRHFIYSAGGGESAEGSLDVRPEEQASGATLRTSSPPSFVPASGSYPARLVFGRDGTLLSQTFDVKSRTLVGDAVTIAEQVGQFLGYHFAAASPDVLVYRAASRTFQLTWLDRDGKTLGTVEEPHPYTRVALSPDAMRIAASINETNDNWNIWLLDLAKGTRIKFSSNLGRDDYPLWSPDGSRLAFSSSGAATTNAAWNLLEKPIGSSQRGTALLESAETKYPTSWSRDGGLLYTVINPKTKNDLWMLPLAGGGKPMRVAGMEFSESDGQFSPDAKWIAYTSDESGRSEIYIQTFPGGENHQVVSSGGGSNPRWKGQDLFYLAPNGKMMAVNPLQKEPAKTLFQTPSGATVWDVTPDGKRFLFAIPAGQNTQAPFTVVLNWQAGLKK